MLIAVIFFLIISLIIVLGVTGPVANQIRSANDDFLSKQSYASAETALEDMIYRYKTGKTTVASQTIALNGGTSTVAVTNTASQSLITVTSKINNITRKMQASLLQGAGVAFNYGLQAGNGGVTLGGGSTINGNIYSNGDIDAISATITGSATAADSAALVADQANDTPTTPTGSINFGNAAAAQDFAQSFQVSTTSPLNKVQLYIKKVGNPSNATIKIMADNAGSPSTTAQPTGTMTLSAGLVTTSYGWVEVTVPNTTSLIPGTTYWLVIDYGTQNASNYYVMGGNTGVYTTGVAKTGVLSGTWNASTLDGYFRIYTGGIASMIGGASYVGGVTIGSAGVGDAWASKVQGASVAGKLYCTTGTNNNKACDSAKGTPSPQALPYSDANIQDWKDDATAGGTISGNYTVDWQGATMGPKKITGNLTVNGGGTLTLTGPLYVVGTVTVTGGGKIALPSSYAKNSETIISDSYMNINGGGSIGSGTSGSYLFLVSTSKCPNDTYCSGNNAIHVSGGAGAIAVNAQKGGILLDGGASLKAAVANYLTISGGSSVTYDAGLASPSFSSGPSGGYTILNWQEVTN